MRCENCHSELKSVYRSLVVESYVSHPVVSGRADLTANDPAFPAYEREIQDGAHGAACSCPHCGADVTELVSE